jgi:hypothetical protein
MKKHNIQTWCRLNKDIQVYTHYCTKFFNDYEPSAELNDFKKGTYLQITMKEPSIYLDLEGNGFLFFNPEDLEEVYIDPCCEFSSINKIPSNIRQEENYPEWFNGNPEDWFLKDVDCIYQG